MNNQEKTKDELIKELKDLQQEVKSLKLSYHKSILEQNEAAEILSRSEEELRSILDSMSDMVFVLSEDRTMKGKHGPNHKIP